MKTRSHHTTAAVANAAAAVGLKVTSTQPIRGRKNSISATDVLTRQVKQKTARINEKTAIVEQKTNAMKQQIELTNDRITKARRKLDVLFNEEAVQELVKQGMNISVDKDGNVTGVTMPVLKRAVPLYDALGLPKVGASRTQVGKTNQKTLPPTHAVATKMQKLTGSTLTAKDIQNMEFMAQYHGTEMEHGGFKTNGEQIRNNHGKMVDKNWHIYGKETYKAQKEKGTGLAKHHAEKCLNLIHTIPETVARYSSICAMLTDEEGRGVGFDFRQLPDNYQGNLSQEEVYDLLAESCGCKNLRTLLKRLTDPKVALRGMRYVRLNGEEEVTSNKNIKQHVYKKFGYRFWFIDGNDTRFDVN